jgi:hypothetical protein
MDVLVAWGAVVLAGLGALAGVFVLSRRIKNDLVRSIVRCLAAVWLLLPWSIQVVPGHYAPAFLVALFEGLFRAEGSARAPLMGLGLASAVVLLLLLIVSLVRRRSSVVTPDDDRTTA